MLVLAIVALSATACSQVHAVCDPQLRRLAADTQRTVIMRSVADCEQHATEDCHSDQACASQATDACLKPARQLDADLTIERDPAFNEALCRELLAVCPP